MTCELFAKERSRYIVQFLGIGESDQSTPSVNSGISKDPLVRFKITTNREVKYILFLWGKFFEKNYKIRGKKI